MGTNPPIPTIPLINEINQDTDRSNKYRKAQNTARNEREHEKLRIRDEKRNSKNKDKKIYRRALMYNKKNSKLFENDVLENPNNSPKEKEEKEKENEISITKEQRNILQNLLKKNAIDNKKAIAKNLEKLYIKKNSIQKMKHFNSITTYNNLVNPKKDIKNNNQKSRNSIKRLRSIKTNIKKSLLAKNSPKKSVDLKNLDKRYSVGDFIDPSNTEKNKSLFTTYASLNGIKNIPSLSNNNIKNNKINLKRNSIQTTKNIYKNNTFNSKKQIKNTKKK